MLHLYTTFDIMMTVEKHITLKKLSSSHWLSKHVTINQVVCTVGKSASKKLNRFKIMSNTVKNEIAPVKKSVVKKSTKKSVAPVTTAIAPVEPKNSSLVNIDFQSFIDDVKVVTNKMQLVAVANKYGIYTTTKPTATKQLNDLYMQLFDGSRIKFNHSTKNGVSSISVYTTKKYGDDIHTLDNSFVFDTVNDGKYRVSRATVPCTTDTLKTVFEFFAKLPMFYINANA